MARNSRLYRAEKGFAIQGQPETDLDSAPLQPSILEREAALRTTAKVVSVEPMMHSSRMTRSARTERRGRVRGPVPTRSRSRPRDASE